MDTSSILRPEQLPFAVSGYVRKEIYDLLEAMERDDINVDCYQMELQGTLRDLGPDLDMLCRNYYINGFWHQGPQYVFNNYAKLRSDNGKADDERTV